MVHCKTLQHTGRVFEFVTHILCECRNIMSIVRTCLFSVCVVIQCVRHTLAQSDNCKFINNWRPFFKNVLLKPFTEKGAQFTNEVWPMQDKADENPAGPFSIISVQLTCWFRNYHNFERKERKLPPCSLAPGTRHHRDQYHLDFHHDEIATMVKPDEKMRWCCKNADWYHHDAKMQKCWLLSPWCIFMLIFINDDRDRWC